MVIPAVVETSVLAYALSPGLRADLGGLVAPLIESYATGVKDFVLSFGIFSPVAYIFAMVVQVFVAPIPYAPVALAGSLVFGVWEGFGLSLAGSIVGSVLSFLAVRRWGEPLVKRLVGGEGYRQYVGVLDGAGWGSSRSFSSPSRPTPPRWPSRGSPDSRSGGSCR